MKTFISIILIVFFSFTIVCQENNSNIWYFGEYAGVDFNHGLTSTLTTGKLNTWEGCASICNELGELLFYTDGLTETININDTSVDFETAELKRVIDFYVELPSEKFIDKLVEELISFRGSSNFDDDVCIICMDLAAGLKL